MITTYFIIGLILAIVTGWSQVSVFGASTFGSPMWYFALIIVWVAWPAMIFLMVKELLS